MSVCFCVCARGVCVCVCVQGVFKEQSTLNWSGQDETDWFGNQSIAIASLCMSRWKGFKHAWVNSGRNCDFVTSASVCFKD